MLSKIFPIFFAIISLSLNDEADLNIPTTHQQEPMDEIIKNATTNTITNSPTTHTTTTSIITLLSVFDIVMKAFYDNSVNSILDNPPVEYKTACEIFLNDTNIKSIDLENDELLENLVLKQKPSDLILISLKSKCLAIVGKINQTLNNNNATYRHHYSSSLPNVNRNQDDDFDPENDEQQCNTSYFQDCTKYHNSVIMIQTIKSLMPYMEKLIGIVDFCRINENKNDSIRNFFLQTQFAEGAQLTTSICAKVRAGIDLERAQDLYKSLVSQIQLFYGNMSAWKLKSVLCKLIKDFTKNSVNNNNRSSVLKSGKIELFKLSDYIMVNYALACYSSEPAVDTSSSENGQMLARFSFNNNAIVYVNKLKVEVERFKRQLQSQFRMHSKALKT